MLQGASSLPNGLGLRPAGPADQPFIQSLYASTRQDLWMAEGEPEYIQSVIDMQFNAQSMGYGDQFPNAMYFVVEKLNEPIGRVTIDFDKDLVHIIDIAFVPLARNKGYGTTVIDAIQKVAGQIKAPVLLSVAVTNTQARQLYERMGFSHYQSGEGYERLIWYPTAEAMRGA